AAGLTHDRDPVRGEMAPKCTAAARVLLLRPVDGPQQLRGMRRGRWQICKPWRRSGAWQGPRRQWVCANGPIGDHQKAIGGDFSQEPAKGRAIVEAAAVAPGDDRQRAV